MLTVDLLYASEYFLNLPHFIGVRIRGAQVLRFEMIVHFIF